VDSVVLHISYYLTVKKLKMSRTLDSIWNS
jgi:hypothetical protein